MNSADGNMDPFRSSAAGGSGASRRYVLPFLASNFLQAPLSALLEYSGILRQRSSHRENDGVVGGRLVGGSRESVAGILNESTRLRNDEVSIRIIGVSDQENQRTGIPHSVSIGSRREGGDGENDMSRERVAVSSERQGEERAGDADGVDLSSSAGEASTSPSGSSVGVQSGDAEGNLVGVSGRDSTYQRYDIQQAARWIEQILPFSLLLLVVFIRQHLQGFFVTIWLAAVMFKSNDILRKQTALKTDAHESIRWSVKAKSKNLTRAIGTCRHCWELMGWRAGRGDQALEPRDLVELDGQLLELAINFKGIKDASECLVRELGEGAHMRCEDRM
ncbi:hypothetical protein HPP92_007341 [Vanilla planifolia]|uniref:Uncharacterized protein n=2 Tax=Vanilla planifolia TaxID=51239 RepID=A0A835VAK2_VANPL|nr:hypothetical protein HPP92_007341 [Vanilla planifolia]